LSGNWIRQNGSQRIIGRLTTRRSAPALAQANESRRWTASGSNFLTGAAASMLMGEFMTAVHRTAKSRW
jgi:pyruvate dehydrogenase (quinone)/pyruvate oxidase